MDRKDDNGIGTPEEDVTQVTGPEAELLRGSSALPTCTGIEDQTTTTVEPPAVKVSNGLTAAHVADLLSLIGPAYGVPAASELLLRQMDANELATELLRTVELVYQEGFADGRASPWKVPQ